MNGQNDAAIAMLKGITPTSPPSVDLAMIYAAMGRYSEAADALQEVPSGATFPPGNSGGSCASLRTAPAVAASPQSLPRLGPLSWVYLYVGAPNRALEYYEDTAEAGFFAAGGTDNAFLWHPSYAAVRKTERFKAFVRKAGYVDYWRAKGWPDPATPPAPTTSPAIDVNR